METLEEKVARVVREKVVVVPYNSRWPSMFYEEKEHLLSSLPKTLIKRVEHFGSTAVPGLAAKPIIDMLVEVSSLDEAKETLPPILEAQGYDYFWRPTWGDNTPPFYMWLIKRDSQGYRTHHIHMVEAHFEHWNRLLFRDYLIEHPQVAMEYSMLKQRLSDTHKNDRVGYTKEKTEFIVRITQIANEYYRQAQQQL